LIIARAKSNVRSDGIVDVLGEANFAPTLERALEAHAPAPR
jgi:hypothetical protein